MPALTYNFDNAIEAALLIISEFEGFETKAYPDPLSGSIPYTIGYGSTRYEDDTPVQLGDTVSVSRGCALLRFRVLHDYFILRSTIPYWNQMSENQQATLLSFAYNLGVHFYGNSGFNTISRNLKDRNWKEVPDTLTLYVNPGSNVEAGLRRRRKAEGKLWMS